MFGKYGAESTTFGEVLLSLVDCSEETRDEITEFIGRAADRAVITSGNLDLAEVPEGRWASWDPGMDSDWERFVFDLQGAGLKDDRILELSKPSGPRIASLCCLWHYPTYRTKRRLYGTILDSTNDCINVQCQKILDHRSVRTYDTYPIRIKYTPGEPDYKKMLGDKVKSIKDVRSRPVLPDIRNIDEIIVNMVFFSYHGMYFLKETKPVDEVVFLNDLIWNGVCEWSRVPVARERHFFALGKELISARQKTSLHLANMYLGKEIKTGKIMPREEAVELLGKYLDRDENAGVIEEVRGLDE
ncbi:hypothetical protein GGI35DRAFT_490422 [Trichoderma velutinum]